MRVENPALRSVMVAPQPPTRSVSGARCSEDSDWRVSPGTAELVTVSQHSPAEKSYKGGVINRERIPNIVSSSSILLAWSCVRLRTPSVFIII